MNMTRIGRIFITLFMSLVLFACAAQEQATITTPEPTPAASVQPAAEPAKPAALAPTDQMMRVALQQRGKPYRYGGSTPEGFDASGLVYFCHQQSALAMPREFREQLAQTKDVAKQKLRPGDLLFFAIGTDKPNHVGIYLGANKFIHAPATHTKVLMSDIRSKRWADALVRGGRFK